MPNFSGIIQLAGFGGGNADGDSPMGASDPSETLELRADSPMGGGGPSETAEQEGDAPMGGGSPTETAAPEGDSPMGGSGPAEAGGIADGDSPMGGTATMEALVGNVLGSPTDGSERPSQGGVGVRISGSAFSERDEIDIVTDMPGLELSGQDVSAPIGQERAEAKFRVAAEVELVRLTLVPGAAPATQVVFTPSGAQARVIVTRILAVALDVSAVVTQPQVDLRKLALGDVLAQVALGFTATDQSNEFPCVANRLVVNSGEDLVLGVPVAGSATTYTVQLSILGRVIPS